MDHMSPTQSNQPPPADSTVPPILNPLLAKIRIPGEILRLPSGGLFYTDGELSVDVKDGEVHIHPMTAIDEITIRSPDLIFSGDAVEQVIRNCVPQILKPRRLLARDVDFLMAAIRKISYGNEFEVGYTHTCEGAKEHKYIIHMDKFIQESKSIDPTVVTGKFSVNLDNGQLVRFFPMRYDQIVEMMQASDNDISTTERRDMMIGTLVGMIQDVDDVSNEGMIREWLNNLPVNWIGEISDAIEATTDWGPDFTVEVVCEDCGEVAVVAAPMNPISFFM